MFAAVFERLLAHYGLQQWWPADDELEIMVGAVLVQRTVWRNAANAIARLKASGDLRADRIAALPSQRLEELIRPAGFFKVKAKRLQALCRLVAAAGGIAGLERLPTQELRNTLLGVHGVGAETADAILGYAFKRPVFVVDAYARRFFSRLAYPRTVPTDNEIKAGCERELETVSRLNELHALVIAHSKASCGRVPACSRCFLASACGFARHARPASA
jgi:endonuclease-3 related protein